MCYIASDLIRLLLIPCLNAIEVMRSVIATISLQNLSSLVRVAKLFCRIYAWSCLLMARWPVYGIMATRVILKVSLWIILMTIRNAVSRWPFRSQQKKVETFNCSSASWPVLPPGGFTEFNSYAYRNYWFLSQSQPRSYI